MLDLNKPYVEKTHYIL